MCTGEPKSYLEVEVTSDLVRLCGGQRHSSRGRDFKTPDLEEEIPTSGFAGVSHDQGMIHGDWVLFPGERMMTRSELVSYQRVRTIHKRLLIG